MQETDRGGDITYHGPGQLVAYPILQLQPLGLNLSRYMRLLERVVMDTVAAFGVSAHREPGATGVWVEMGGFGEHTTGSRDQGSRIGEAGSQRSAHDAASTVSPEPRSPNPEPPRTAKLCALGVRIRKNTTMHGLALNVKTDLSHFETIVPCGLEGRAVTSLEALLGNNCPPMADVKAEFVAQMRRAVEAASQGPVD